jgi:hypothetical protein
MRRLSFFLVGLGLWGGLSGEARATTVEPPSFTELASRADFVVRARVTHLAYETRQRDGRELIFTRVTLDVREVIAGDVPEQVVLTLLGGRHGEREMRVAGVPEFRVGDEDILFVAGNGRDFYPLYAVMYGRYPVKRDKRTGREYVTRSNGVPLGDVAEVALPMGEGPAATLQRRLRPAGDGMLPAEFAARIRQDRDMVQGAKDVH